MPGLSEFGLRQMDVELRPNKDGMDSISALELRSGQTYFMRVKEQQGKRFFLRPVTAEHRRLWYRQQHAQARLSQT